MESKDAIKLTARQRASLDAIIRSSIAERTLEQAEGEKLAERQALAVQLRDLRARAANESRLAGRERDAAADELERQRRAVLAATQRVIDAEQRLTVSQHGGNIAKLERELRVGADPRISDWRGWLRSLASKALADLRIWNEERLTMSGPRTVVMTNEGEVVRASETLRMCIERSDDLELLPLSYAEVSAALAEMGRQLERPLAAVRLNPPQLANDGEIGAPLPFPGEWLVGEITRG